MILFLTSPPNFPDAQEAPIFQELTHVSAVVAGGWLDRQLGNGGGAYWGGTLISSQGAQPCRDLYCASVSFGFCQGSLAPV